MKNGKIAKANKSKKNFKNIIKKYIIVYEQEKEAKVIKDDLKGLILDAYKDLGITSYEVHAGDDSSLSMKTYIVSKRRSVKVLYNMAEVKKRIDKELYNELAIRDVTIINFESFVELMKKYKVPSKKVLGLIQISEKMNQEAFQRAYDIGEIDLKKLKGAYEINVSESLNVSGR